MVELWRVGSGVFSCLWVLIVLCMMPLRIHYLFVLLSFIGLGEFVR